MLLTPKNPQQHRPAVLTKHLRSRHHRVVCKAQSNHQIRVIVPWFATGDGASVEADVEQYISRLWNGFLSLFGKDADSVEAKKWLGERTAAGIQRTSTVQVVGRSKPVPLANIYQSTRLLVEDPEPVMMAGGPRAWLEPDLS